MKRNTKDAIVRSAESLIRKRGYNAFSYNDLSEQLGIRKASIHYHFATKGVLGAEVIRNYRGKMEYLMDKLKRTEERPERRLDTYIQFFRTAKEQDEMCPAGVLTAEFHTLGTDIQQEVRGLFATYLDWLTEILEDGRKKGAFRFDGDARARAMYISSAIEGALLLSRACGQNEFEVVADQIRKDLGLDA